MDGHSSNYTKLTDEQRSFYEDNGYVVIPKLVDPDLLDECSARFRDICNGKINAGDMVLMKDGFLKSKGKKGEFLYIRIQDFNFDEVLFKYVSYKPIVDLVESIIGTDNITSYHTMVINKPPNSDRDYSRHPAHQDLVFVPMRPVNSMVGVWTAMERSDESNGCLYVAPGSHRREVLPHDYPQNVRNNMFLSVENYEKFSTVNLIMDKGDTVFIHPALVHGSGPNLTDGFRKAISAHYVDSNCQFVKLDDYIEGSTQQMLKLRGLPPMTCKGFLQWKSRVVRGRPGNYQLAIDAKL